MSFVPRVTLTVACAAAAATLATSSIAAERWAGATSWAPTFAPAPPAPTHSEFSRSLGPPGGVALFRLAHISARPAQPRP
jgi:hypothetical protein